MPGALPGELAWQHCELLGTHPYQGVRSRPRNYGSHVSQYYAKYGKDTGDVQNRIKNSGWPPDPSVSPALGALRWYNGANPRLTELYAPKLEAYIK